MRNWITRASAVLAILAITACVNHATGIYNVDKASYNTPDTLNAEQAEKAIRNAGTSLGWQMDTIKPGLMRGTLNLRKHVAIVDISYDGRGYSIDYIDSDNLNYEAEKGVIHKSYNKWVQNLERQIRIESGSV